MKKGFKECPFCANEIKKNATKCQYCGEFLSKGEDKKEKLKENSKKEILNNEPTNNNELTKANNNIKTAFIFGCIGAGITLIMIFGQQNWGLSLGLIYFGVLLYFLYCKKNRMAALFLFIEYVFDTIYSFIMGGTIGILGILILLGLFMGVIGTFSYHKIMNDTKLSTGEIVILVIGLLITLLEILGLFVS